MNLIMNDPYKAITKLLQSYSIDYEELEHEPVFTSEQAAKIRGLKLSQGAKALLLCADGQFFLLAIVPGNRKLDTKALKKILGIKDLRFATPKEVKEVMGCEIGACYPLGVIANLKTYVDNHLAQEEIISFNAGLHTKSIKMKCKDYLKLAQPEIVDISTN